ncbi:MAG: hypothetical protein CM15mP74_24620 [Halieaceae bacterium]|nr:MAG: hypothetical protein CM15mP74_24620 [Halieaceae bacterium]
MIPSYRALTLDWPCPEDGGRPGGGIAAYRRAIDLRPNFGETYYSLANLKTFRFTEQDVDAMSQRLANDSLPVECRVHFAFR